MRRADHAARRGTSLQGSDRTAGDSSPVTQINGRLRGRPGPAGGTEKHTRPDQRVVNARFVQHDAHTAPGSELPRGRQHRGAPPDRQRSRPGARPPCAGAHDDATRGAKGTRQRQAAQSPGAAPRHRRRPDVGADERGPRGPRLRGPSPARSRTGTSGNVTQDTQESCRPMRNLSRSPRVTSADGGGPVPGGGCRSSLLPGPVHRPRSYFLGGTDGIPRNGSRSAPKASAATAGCRGSTGRRRS